MLKKIIMIFIISISFSNAITIKTNLNEINIFDDKSNKVKIVEEKVKRNKKGNKDGKVYIKTKNNDEISANYIDGKLNGKLVAKNKDWILEIDYKDNFKNGKYSFKLDDFSIETAYLYDIKHGIDRMKVFSNTVEKKYFNGKKNGLEILTNEDKMITMNLYEDIVFGKVEEKYSNGIILNYYVDDNVISGKLSLILDKNKEIIMSLIDNVQIGNVVYINNGNKKIYNDFSALNKELEILKYLPQNIVFLKNEKIGNEYISKLNINGIKKEFIYNIKDGMIEGKVKIKYFKNNKLDKLGSYEFKKGSIDGNINLKLSQCKLNFIMKNNLKEGKYILDCDSGNLVEEYKEGKIEGVSISKDKTKNLEKIIKYNNGIEVFREIKNEEFHYKKTLDGTKWDIYEKFIDGKVNLVHTGIIEGKKSKHKLYINDELVDEFEGNEDDLPLNYRLLELYEYK